MPPVEIVCLSYTAYALLACICACVLTAMSNMEEGKVTRETQEKSAGVILVLSLAWIISVPALLMVGGTRKIRRVVADHVGTPEQRKQLLPDLRKVN